MKKIIFLLLPVFIILFQECNNASEGKEKKQVEKRMFSQYSEYTSKIIKSDSFIIRGLNLNVSASVIRKVEQANPVTEKKDSLEFKYRVDSITSYSIKYTLHNDSLEEINIWVYSNNPDVSAQIFNDLKDYYQKKLPNPIEDKGYVVYNCVQGERRPFIVSISDFSTPTKGQINLVIYKDR